MSLMDFLIGLVEKEIRSRSPENQARKEERRESQRMAGYYKEAKEEFRKIAAYVAEVESSLQEMTTEEEILNVKPIWLNAAQEIYDEVLNKSQKRKAYLLQMSELLQFAKSDIYQIECKCNERIYYLQEQKRKAIEVEAQKSKERQIAFIRSAELEFDEISLMVKEVERYILTANDIDEIKRKREIWICDLSNGFQKILEKDLERKTILNENDCFFTAFTQQRIKIQCLCDSKIWRIKDLAKRRLLEFIYWAPKMAYSSIGIILLNEMFFIPKGFSVQINGFSLSLQIVFLISYFLIISLFCIRWQFIANSKDIPLWPQYAWQFSRISFFLYFLLGLTVFQSFAVK